MEGAVYVISEASNYALVFWRREFEVTHHAGGLTGCRKHEKT